MISSHTVFTFLLEKMKNAYAYMFFIDILSTLCNNDTKIQQDVNLVFGILE